MKTRTQKSRCLKRDQTRMRRALLGLETLEGRQLMAGDLVSLAPDSVFAIQDQTGQILDVLGNDRFDSAYSGARQITSVSAGDRGGEFSISQDGRSVRYTPPPGYASRENESPQTAGPALPDSTFADAETFTYVVDGAFEQSARIYVRPVVSRDSYDFDVNDQNHVLDVLSNDTFFPGYAGSKKITAVSAVTQEGTVSISTDGKSLVYSPQVDFVGVEEFSYVVDDKYEAHVLLNVRTAVRGDYYGESNPSIVRNDGSHVLNVLANDCYPVHQNLLNGSCTQIDVQRITSVEQPTSGGTVTIAADGRSLVYKSADNFSGGETFSYIADGKYRASVTIHVGNPDDSAEFFQNDSEQTINVLANDLFRDGYTGARVITGVSTAVGTVTIAADGKSLSYKPKQDWTGNDSFSYTVDGTLTANVSVFVRQTVQSDWVSVIENSAERKLDVMANDQFPSDYVGERKITQVTDSQQGAIVKIAADGKSLLYQPKKGFFGFDQLTYTVDGTQVANVSVYVWRPFQDAWSGVYQFTGDNVLDPIQLDNNSYRLTQLADYHGAIKITALGTPDHGGTATVSADGKHVLYTPAPEFHGQETFTYTVDGEFTATITISVNPSVMGDDTFNVEQNSQNKSLGVLNNDVFPANYRGAKHVTGVSATKSGGVVSIDPTTALVSYTPAKDFYGRDSFTYTVDGVQTATVNVTVLRRLRDDQFHVAMSSQDNVLSVLVNDDFGSTYTNAKRITAVNASAGGGTVVIAADGHAVLYTPKAGFQGNDSFRYEVDGQFIATATVTVSDTRSLPAARFNAASDLETYLKNAGLAKYADQFGKDVPWGWGYPGLVFYDTGVVRGDTSAVTFNSSAPSHSETNVQVAGVDEGDLVETDGNFLYTLTGQELVIVSAFPAEDAHVVSRYAFLGTPTAMFLKGNLLTVISHTTGGTVTGGLINTIRADGLSQVFSWPGTVPTNRGTTVTVLDISDRAAPQMLQETKLDGDYFDARATDNFVYIVARSEFNSPAPLTVCRDLTEEEKAAYISTNYPSGYLWGTPSIPGQKCTYESAESYAARASTFVNDALPHYTTYDKDGQVVRSGLLVDATDIYGDGGKYSSQLYSLLTIDIASPDPGPIATTGLLTGSDGYVPQQPVLFASADSLYLFDAKSTDNPEDAVVTKAWQIQFDKTSGQMRPIATGQLPGTVLNQFSIDETDGRLRVATTNLSPTASRTENNVFVLHEDGGVLEFVGGIQDLAPTETIYSVRFFGDRGIVVTFRQIDPLFTIDLSDPDNPTVAGSLKLPGFSSYIQPIDRDHVLTFGKGGPNGWDGPPQISLFNIQDLQHPTLIDQASVGTRTWSEDAWNDHHAVAYFPEYNVLAIPSNRTEYNYTNRPNVPWSTEYHETFVFQIDTTSATRSDAGIQTLGRIAQDSTVRRSVRIEDNLYAVADGKITIVNVLDPTDRRATVDLRVTPVIDPGEIQVLAGTNTATPFDDERLGKAIIAAQKSLAQRLNIREQAGVMVTAERNGSQDNFQVVLRAGDKQYLFHASAAGEATEVQADFSFAVGAGRDWHNSAQPLDANGDGGIAPSDALLVINQLNLYGSRLLSNSPVRAITSQTIDPAGLWSFQVDTNGDGNLAPLDALLVINYLNDPATSQLGFLGEGEGGSNIATTTAFVKIGFDTLAGTTTGLPGPGDFASSNSAGILAEVTLEKVSLEKPLTAAFPAASILTTNSIATSKRLTTIVPDDHPSLAATHNDVALVELMDELTGEIGD